MTLGPGRGIEGIGLHRGETVRLELVRGHGPLQFERNGIVRPIDAFRVSSTLFATSIACDAFELHTIEHFLAALGGLGVRDGCRLIVTGGAELPMFDGGARKYTAWIGELGLSSQPSRLRVARQARIEIERSTYELEPSETTSVCVEVELPASCGRTASWNGAESTFISEIAPARTFAIDADVAELTRLALARHIEPASVLVVADDAIHGQGPIAADEPARHKLLDLIGDAYLYGGPPRGVLRAFRPGHARNHAAFTRALEMGVLVKESA